MNLLEQRIVKDGRAVNDSALDASSFLTRQVDSQLMNACADEIVEQFKDSNIDRIVTIESGGIAISMLVAVKLNIPLVVMKKKLSLIDVQPMYLSEVHSFTKGTKYTLNCTQSHINEGDNILFVDDVLAFGNAFKGVLDISNQANANLVASAFLFEKTFQHGRAVIEESNVKVLSLARLKSLSNGIELSRAC